MDKVCVELTLDQMHEVLMVDLLDQLNYCEDKKVRKAIKRVLDYNVTPTERAVLEERGIL